MSPAADAGLETVRNELMKAIEREAPGLCALSNWMSEHPELSMQEYETSRRYIDFLSSRGFDVETRIGDMETAFTAEWGSKQAKFSVALLAEMDALPGIGHACGHNLSGPASLLAATALREVVDAEQLRLVVVGCPAEETGEGKPRLVEAGIFDDVDAAMMAHASDMRRAHRLFLGNQKFEMVFKGKAAHAAAYPEEGINALDGVIALFVGIGLLRQQLPLDVRIHGIITDGGKAPNIIPERAAARVWVRALDEAHLESAVDRVVACAKGAAETSGTEVEVIPTRGCSPPMKPNLPLADTYRRQLNWLGLPETDHAPSKSIGSSDITHISRVVPTIHPNFPIGEKLSLHTRAFADAAATSTGEAGLLEGARAMALTVAEILADGDLEAQIADAR